MKLRSLVSLLVLVTFASVTLAQNAGPTPTPLPVDPKQEKVDRGKRSPDRPYDAAKGDKARERKQISDVQNRARRPR